MSTKDERNYKTVPENYISSYTSLGFCTVNVYEIIEKTMEWEPLEKKKTLIEILRKRKDSSAGVTIFDFCFL